MKPQHVPQTSSGYSETCKTLVMVSSWGSSLKTQEFSLYMSYCHVVIMIKLKSEHLFRAYHVSDAVLSMNHLISPSLQLP